MSCYVCVLRQGSAPNFGHPGVGPRHGHVRQRLQCERKALFFHRDIKKERWNSELLKPSGKTLGNLQGRSLQERRAQEPNAPGGVDSSHVRTKCFYLIS